MINWRCRHSRGVCLQTKIIKDISKDLPKIGKTNHTSGKCPGINTTKPSFRSSNLLLLKVFHLFSPYQEKTNTSGQNHAFQRRLRTAVRYQREWLWEAAGVSEAGKLEESAGGEKLLDLFRVVKNSRILP